MYNENLRPEIPRMLDWFGCFDEDVSQIETSQVLLGTVAKQVWIPTSRRVRFGTDCYHSDSKRWPSMSVTSNNIRQTWERSVLIHVCNTVVVLKLLMQEFMHSPSTFLQFSWTSERSWRLSFVVYFLIDLQLQKDSFTIGLANASTNSVPLTHPAKFVHGAMFTCMATWTFARKETSCQQSYKCTSW